MNIVDKWSVADIKGNILGEIQYDDIENYENGHFIVRQNNLYGMIDLEGNLIVKPKYK